MSLQLSLLASECFNRLYTPSWVDGVSWIMIFLSDPHLLSFRVIQLILVEKDIFTHNFRRLEKKLRTLPTLCSFTELFTNYTGHNVLLSAALYGEGKGYNLTTKRFSLHSYMTLWAQITKSHVPVRLKYQAYSYCIAQSTYIIKSTTVYVPSSELGLSQHLSRQRVCPSPQNRGGGHTRLPLRGWGSPNSDDWRKSLALCLLCAVHYIHARTRRKDEFSLI